jgi:outer membrane protein assembly factor BamB
VAFFKKLFGKLDRNVFPGKGMGLFLIGAVWERFGEKSRPSGGVVLGQTQKSKIMKYIYAFFLLGLGCQTASSFALGEEPANKAAWAMFRGDAQATGVAKGELPEKLELLWTFSTKKGGFEATAAVVGDAVYVGDTGGKFHALNLSDGKPRWSFPAPMGFTASPAVKYGRVFIGDSDGNFYCLDARSGEKVWAFQADGEIDSSANFYEKPSPPAPLPKGEGKDDEPSKGEGSYVLFGSQDAMLYCLDAKSGTLVWKFEGGDQIRCFPAVLDHYAFIAGCDAALSMIDLENRGRIVGKVPIDSPTMCTPAVMDGKIFVGTEGNVFFCIEPKEQKILWRFEAGKLANSYRSSAAVSKEAVIVGSRDKRLHALDPATGKPLWSFATRNRVDSSPVIVGSRVFVGSADGRIYGINIKTGAKVWQFEAGGAVVASPAVAEGRMVIGNNQGELFCFGAK